MKHKSKITSEKFHVNLLYLKTEYIYIHIYIYIYIYTIFR